MKRSNDAAISPGYVATIDVLSNPSAEELDELERMIVAATKKARSSATPCAALPQPPTLPHPQAARLPPEANSAPTAETAAVAVSHSQIVDTSKPMTSAESILKEYFGYDAFRPGQAEAVQEAVHKRDVCVFWSSGSGKSICYLIPALLTNKISLVVSPLISLMMDQCNSINNRAGVVAGKQLACFLGSGQTDNSIEPRALAGEFLIIYITPEKLETFLPQLGRLHTRAREIGLLAVDEAHCISQWGHDFRSAYMNLHTFRSDSALSGIPIMALTATASTQVREDIIKRLRLTDGCRQLWNSVDRTNLHITVRPIKAGGVIANMHQVVDLLEADKEAGGTGSTIVYMPTTKGVETVADHLNNVLQPSGLRVTAYHGKMTPSERSEAHSLFLTGQCSVIVATVAFGMGIDKPDVRRIIHYGSPKSMEDYYQQIGRAGRDGLVSQCLLLHSDSELMGYASGFYTDNLSTEAKKRHMIGIESMRQFANSSSCRRVEVLRHFQEKAPYSKCNTCDNCGVDNKFAADLQRDFSEESMLLLSAIFRNTEKGIRGVISEAIDSMNDILREKWRTKHVLDKIITGLLPPLEAAGYIVAENKTFNAGGGNRAYVSYRLTPRGNQWRSDRENRASEQPLILPVPPAVRIHEEEQQIKRERLKSELSADSVDLRLVPQEVLDDVDGEGGDWVKWHRSLKQDRLQGFESRAKAKETLLERIMKWREDTAIALKMSPENICRESLARRIAYTKIYSSEALCGVGLRLPNDAVEELSRIISSSLVDLELARLPIKTEAGAKMVFREGRVTAPLKQIMNIPARGKLKPAAWEESFEKFRMGVGIESIATMHPKGVKVETVIGHLLDAFKFGKTMDMTKLARQADQVGNGPPNQREWEVLQSAAEAANINPENGSFFRLKDLLACVPEVSHLLNIDGEASSNVALSDTDRALTAHWYGVAKWWSLFRLTQTEVQFATNVFCGHSESS